MKKKSNAFTRSFIVNWVLTLILLGVLWLLVDKYFALSLLLGSMTSMMMMSSMLKQNNRLLQENATNVEKRYFRGYVFRYFFYAFVLVAAAMLENFDIVGVAIGLLLFRVSLFISMFLEKRGVIK
jgi:hypothetical protein